MPNPTRQHRTASERDALARARTADTLALIDACLAEAQIAPRSASPTRHRHEADQ